MQIDKQWWRRLAFAAGSSALAVLLLIVVTFFYRPAITRGGSMSPTLNDGDISIASVYRYTPERGDVVIIPNTHAEGRYIVKRIIGLAGDHIDINYDTGKVVRNGRVLDEAFATEPILVQGDIKLPLTVPESKVFVLGDNRNHSTDSRTSYTGMIDSDIIEGKVVLCIFPFERFGRIE